MRQPKLKNCSSVRNRDSSRNDAAGKQEADRRAELREHAVPRALARRRVLGGQQHRAAPFAAEADALAEPAERQQQRRGKADRVVGRQHANQHRRNPHRHQRRDERGLAADAVAEMAEQHRADRPRDEGDRKRRQRGERGRGRVGGREEQPGKDEHGGGGVDVKVEELDRGPDQAGEQDLAGRIYLHQPGKCPLHPVLAKGALRQGCPKGVPYAMKGCPTP